MPSAHPLMDHDEIRQWAEARHAHPACVRRTGGKGDPGMIRLDFPGFSGARSLSPISWNQWFKSFDANHLALLVQDQTAAGRRSNFNKLVSRESIADGAAPRQEGTGGSSRARRAKPSTAQAGSRSRQAAGKSARSSAASRKAAGSSGTSRTRSTRSTKSKARSTKRAGNTGARGRR